MGKYIVWILLLNLVGRGVYAVDNLKDPVLMQTDILSAKYLSYNFSNPEDSVLRVCKDVENRTLKNGDYRVEFQVKQLAVNALCLKGDIGSAIAMAKEMYKEAKDLNYPLGKALALQAMGATYMYAGQYSQALSIFLEAEPSISSAGDSLVKINLAVQQLHASMGLKDTLGMERYFSRVRQLVEHLAPELREYYLFYSVCYESMLQIIKGQVDEIEANLTLIERLMPGEQAFNWWRYYIYASYYNLKADYPQALENVDLALSVMKQLGNMNEFKNLMYEKAILLEKMGDDKGACDLYLRVDSLTNILNIQYYTRQIESLHMTYYVDQAKIENARMRNEFLTYVLLGVLGCMLIAFGLIIMARKRNRELVLSSEKLKKIREITADSIQSKSMFLSNMSHDLRTPLNGIVGFSEILTTMEDIDAELKEQCRDTIKQNSNLLMKLVNDIIDFSSLKSGEFKFDFGKYDVVVMSRNVIQTVGKVKKTEAELLFSSEIDKLEVETDIGRLQQVLFNILVNATKFTKEGYIRLDIRFDKKANEVVFSVEDTGCGIPLEKQARIFERFEKLHESVQGVGLGLSICKLIIQRVHGKIRIDDTYTGGTRFIFTHPVVQNSKTGKS